MFSRSIGTHALHRQASMPQPQTAAWRSDVARVGMALKPERLVPARIWDPASFTPGFPWTRRIVGCHRGCKSSNLACKATFCA